MSSSKAGKAKPKKTPPPPPPQITVQQCLVWPEPAAKKPAPTAKKAIKPKQTSPKPASAVQPPQEERKKLACCQLGGEVEGVKQKEEGEVQEVGSVSEAMRGWPKKAGQVEEINWDAYYAQNENDDVNVDSELNMRELSKSKKAIPPAPAKKDKAKKVVEVEEPSMGDLMAHRYLREYQDELKANSDKEEMKRLKQSSGDKEGREKSKIAANIKANRSGQLRSISLAEKVDQSPLDLWKMNKFKNTKSKITSKRIENGQSSPSDEAYISKLASYKGGYPDDDYTDAMDDMDNADPPPAGFYQDDGLDSPCSFGGSRYDGSFRNACL